MSSRIAAPADAAVRQRLIARDQSFIVQAPAGSGKTELLMQRFLNLLGDPAVKEPESVLAITFTRKAASQMRNRILEALEAAGKPEPEGLAPHEAQTRALGLLALERDRELGWHLLENPSRLQVRTVDSFCESLVRQLPLEDRFFVSGDVTEDAKPLYEEAARRVLLMLGGADERTAEAVAALLDHLDNNSGNLQRLMVGMLEKREQWLRLLGGAHTLTDEELESLRREKLEPALAETVRYELHLTRQAVDRALPRDLRKELFRAMRHAAAHVAEEHAVKALARAQDLPGTEPGDVARWLAQDAFFFSGERHVRRKLDSRHGFPTSDRAIRDRCLKIFQQLECSPEFTGEVCARLARLQLLPAATYPEAQWKLLRALFWLLPLAAATLKTVFAETGRVDFSEVAQAAAAGLGVPDHPSDLALRLGERIRHILVDEFQDTSVSQVDLLCGLLATWDEQEGHTLFVVGDPMQSIYGFRDAQVSLFERARREGVGGQRLAAEELLVNFRSQQGLVEWFNAAFPRILTGHNEVTGAVPYSRAEAIQPRGSEPVSIHAFAGKDYAEEADCVGGLIEQALAETEAGTVAVLVRARSHLSDIVRVLEARQVLFRAVKIDPLGERQAVRDLDALAHALLQLGDRAAWLAVLRGPGCGLELADLAALCEDDAQTPVWELIERRMSRLSPAGQQRLARVVPALGAALAAHGRRPLHTWVEGAWISLGGLAAVRPGDDGKADLRDVEAYLDLLENTSNAGELPEPRLLERKLQELYAPPDTTDGIRVELMTIHNAKGLEFDTVIVPGLGRRPEKDDPRLLYWSERVLEGRLQLLLGALEPAGKGRNNKGGSIEDYLRQLQKDRAHEENKRLLYVAATRARRKLHLLGQMARPGGKMQETSLLSILCAVPEIAARFKNLPEPAITPEPAAAKSGARLRRLPLDWQLTNPPSLFTWTNAATARGMEPVHTFNWASDTLRRIGTVTHAFLHQIAREGLRRWDEAMIGRRAGSIRAALQSAGISPLEADGAGAKVATALRNVLRDARGRWILEAHEEAQSELEISAIVDGTVHRLKLDRTFVEAGERWIIDYKAADREGGAREEFLARQLEKYRPDLERYRQAIATIDPRPVKLALYFPLLGEFRELPAAASRPNPAE